MGTSNTALVEVTEEVAALKVASAWPDDANEEASFAERLILDREDLAEIRSRLGLRALTADQLERVGRAWHRCVDRAIDYRGAGVSVALEARGVKIIARPPTFKCLACGAVWTAPGGPPGEGEAEPDWQCPKGCNAKAESDQG